MLHDAAIGVDVGTSSTKGVLVALDGTAEAGTAGTAGTVLRSAVREHAVDRPGPGRFEMDAEVWWEEFAGPARELTAPGDVRVVAAGVSGMGPCVLLTDERDRPLRPAVLYGVDTRPRPAK